MRIYVTVAIVWLWLLLKKTVIKASGNSGNKLLLYFYGLRSMPAKAGCLVTGLSWIRTQREVLPLTITLIRPKYSGQNRVANTAKPSPAERSDRTITIETRLSAKCTTDRNKSDRPARQCMFCKKMYTRLTHHVKAVHKDEPSDKTCLTGSVTKKHAAFWQLKEIEYTKA